MASTFHGAQITTWIFTLLLVADDQHRTKSVPTLVERLQRDDPTYRREFEKLYGPGLRALASEELVTAAPTAEFGPED